MVNEPFKVVIEVDFRKSLTMTNILPSSKTDHFRLLTTKPMNTCHLRRHP
jgi:hypothetical protein